MELVDNLYPPSQLDRFAESPAAQELINPPANPAFVPPQHCVDINRFNGKRLAQITPEARKAHQDFSRFLIPFSCRCLERMKSQDQRISLVSSSLTSENQRISPPQGIFLLSSYVLYDLFALLMLIRCDWNASGSNADGQASFR
jgi:hypothetical protein